MCRHTNGWRLTPTPCPILYRFVLRSIFTILLLVPFFMQSGPVKFCEWTSWFAGQQAAVAPQQGARAAMPSSADRESDDLPAKPGKPCKPCWCDPLHGLGLSSNSTSFHFANCDVAIDRALVFPDSVVVRCNHSVMPLHLEPIVTQRATPLLI